MKKRMMTALLLAVALTGCGGRELADVTLLQTLGVDGAGPVELTALGGQEEREVYTLWGEDVTRAQEGLKALGDTRLAVTHVSQLVLGSDVPVAQTLWQAMTHRESGYGATVWLTAEGLTAGELLAAAKNAPARLKSLEENAGVEAPTILAALSDLERQGWVELPVLDESGGELQVADWRRVEVD